MNPPPYGADAASRAHEVLRALRRTGVAHESEADTVNRVLTEVRPSEDDLLEALSEATSMSDSDPGKPRIIALLNAALRTGRFRPT